MLRLHLSPPPPRRLSTHVSSMPSARSSIDRMEWSPSRAVVVVIDPTTGQVLAMDGRARGRKESALGADARVGDRLDAQDDHTAAALEERTITLDQRFGCGETRHRRR